jgi:hypothetical protein
MIASSKSQQQQTGDVLKPAHHYRNRSDVFPDHPSIWNLLDRYPIGDRIRLLVNALDRTARQVDGLPGGGLPGRQPGSRQAGTISQQIPSSDLGLPCRAGDLGQSIDWASTVFDSRSGSVVGGGIVYRPTGGAGLFGNVHCWNAIPAVSWV